MYPVFSKALRDSRRTIIALSIGFALYALFVLAFYPAILEEQESFDEMMQSYPEEMIGFMTGGQDLSEFSISDPGTFLNTEFSIWMVLIMGAIVIRQALNSVTNPERDGTMDMMMSLPVSRTEVLLGRIAAMVVMLFIVLTASIVALLIGRAIWPEFDVPVIALARAMYGALFLLMVVGGFTFVLATVFPSRARFIGGLAYLFLIGSYILHGFTGVIDSLSGLHSFFIFDYYNVRLLINEGIDAGDWALLIGLAAALLTFSWWNFERKELGV
jgi:ABC-2 type transport system permease protein